MSDKILQNKIKLLIKNSETCLDDINQYCHNKGILFDKRIEIIFYLYFPTFLNTYKSF